MSCGCNKRGTVKKIKTVSKTARRAAMKACATKHKITTRTFRSCVRKKVGK